MATIKRFEEIKAWQKARVLNSRVGDIIDKGQFKRNFRLIDQVEGSAGSIMDNIAEGFERSGNKEFVQFLYIAKGSCGEFRSQLYRAVDRKYINRPWGDYRERNWRLRKRYYPWKCREQPDHGRRG